MTNKQAIANIIANEAINFLKNHAELYNGLPIQAVKYLDTKTTAVKKTKKNPAKQPAAKLLHDNDFLSKSNTPKIEQPVKEQRIPDSSNIPCKLLPELCIIKTEVENCTACALHKTRSQTVFGEGSNKIRLVCIGEAPGEEEDKTGRPFVGRAGQLLTKMLEAINIQREDIFICNVLKCRPPMNRDPNSDEVISCSSFLDKQLAILQPQYILALGRVAAKRLLNLDYTMAQFRTQMHEYKSIPVVVTYHPSALLRNPNWKQPAWEDLQKIQKLLGL